ncbi:aldehyde dehydrogenase family protein [Bacillus carboniphilus]|uniref:Aldehyde dehydrogenase family protein n=1 Tax=Bacillus carboniphilus TaxID=86663 RepID=A0ABP3FWF4_9BACI
MNQVIDVKEKYNHFIDGKWVEPINKEYFEAYNPSTGDLLGLFARGDAEDVEVAVKSAEEGFQAWNKKKPYERGQVLNKIAHLLREKKEDLAYLESLDTGKPLSVSRFDVETCARYFEYMGGVADKILGEVIPASNEHLVYTEREPYGVTGHIVPWNGPITMAGRSGAVALAAGNSIVMKPAEQTCITTLLLAELCIEAGLPKGVFNVVTGYGSEAGEAVVNHPGIRKLTFTGSVKTGVHVAMKAAERVVPISLELGGKSPNIVFEDADLDAAAKGAMKTFVMNSGQICCAGTRLLVQKNVMDSFVERLIEEVQTVRVGNALEDPTIGPVVSQEQLDRIQNYISIGEKEGAEIAYGGKRLEDCQLANGYFVEPTVFKNVTNSMRIAREEIFGPVVSIIPFDTEEEAVEIANDSEYGLAAGLWSQNIHRCHRVAKQLQAGQVYLNDYQPIGVEAPFGGYKKSGIGREKGLESIHDYTQLKTIISKI